MSAPMPRNRLATACATAGCTDDTGMAYSTCGGCEAQAGVKCKQGTWGAGVKCKQVLGCRWSGCRCGCVDVRSQWAQGAHDAGHPGRRGAEWQLSCLPSPGGAVRFQRHATCSRTPVARWCTPPSTGAQQGLKPTCASVSTPLSAMGLLASSVFMAAVSFLLCAPSHWVASCEAWRPWCGVSVGGCAVVCVWCIGMGAWRMQHCCKLSEAAQQVTFIALRLLTTRGCCYYQQQAYVGAIRLARDGPRHVVHVLPCLHQQGQVRLRCELPGRGLHYGRWGRGWGWGACTQQPRRT